MEDRLDQLINLDLNQRGVAWLHPAARARLGRPLAAAAAERLAAVPRGERVLLTTGLAARPWASVALIENDGPSGTAVLARALSLGLGAIPVLVAEEEVLDTLSAMLRAVGLVVVAEAPRHASGLALAEVRPYPQEDRAARSAAAPLLDTLRPAALVSVERVGRNAQGVYHNAGGQDISLGKAGLDHLFEEAARRGVPTIGVGDGGNEIGMGLVVDEVRRHVPFGDRCVCGCGGGLATVTATEILVTAGVSNWGCYAITACLALTLGRPDLLHTPGDEERLLQYGVELGLLDALRGTIDHDVDAIPLSTHMAMVELIGVLARRGIER